MDDVIVYTIMKDKSIKTDHISKNSEKSEKPGKPKKNTTRMCIIQ